MNQSAYITGIVYAIIWAAASALFNENGNAIGHMVCATIFSSAAFLHLGPEDYLRRTGQLSDETTKAKE